METQLLGLHNATNDTRSCPCARVSVCRVFDRAVQLAPTSISADIERAVARHRGLRHRCEGTKALRVYQRGDLDRTEKRDRGVAELAGVGLVVVVQGRLVATEDDLVE